MTKQRGWPLFPIWVVVLFAVGFYVIQHYASLIAFSHVPCEAKDWSLLELATAPLAGVAYLTVRAVLYALRRRPLALVMARIYAHVARVVLALVLAVFSLSLIAIAVRAAGANSTREEVRVEPGASVIPGAAGPSHLVPFPAGSPVLALLEKAATHPAVCRPALPGYVDRHPWRIGSSLAAFLIVTGLIIRRRARAPETVSGSRRNARVLRKVPARELGLVTFVLLLVWPGRLLADAVLHGGLHFGANPVRVCLLLLSAVWLAWWATSQAFRGLELAVDAAIEFSNFESTPHPDYTAKLASEDHADILVFSDMHLAATIDGHTMHTMDEKTESFDDGTVKLVDSLLSRVRPAAIIVAGDVTDTGHPSSWDRATELLKRPEIPTYVAPGNHDVHFRWLTPELVEKQGAVGLVLEEVFATDEPHVVSRDSIDEEEIARHIDAIAPAGKRTKGRHFPILYQNDALRISVLVLDSNRRPPTSPISNAIGLVGEDQLEAAAELLDTRPPGYGLLIVLHHHVIPPDTLGLHVGLRCEDAEAVLYFAADHDADAIIHGHKHMPYVYRALVKNHPLLVVSCGSTLYDAVGPQKATVQRASAAGLYVKNGHVVDVAFFRSDD